MTYLNFIGEALLYYLVNDWPIILLGILIAASTKVFVDPEKLKNKLLKHSKIAVPAAVALGAFTPLCACGTMAVVISLFLTRMPWGPVMAFLISSPLTSPSEFLFEGSFMGWRFAISMLITSIAIGLLAGYLATALETKTPFFKDQFRILDKPKQVSSTLDTTGFTVVEKPVTAPVESQYESQYESHYESQEIGKAKKVFDMKGKSKEFAKELWETGVKKILFYFMIFIVIGKTIEFIIPMDFQLPYLSEDSILSVIIGATIGLPLYVNSASSLPLMQSMVASGVSEAAIFAFLIAGKATGIPVIIGMLTFLKKRAIAYYIGIIWVGAVVAGTISIYVWQWFSF